MRTSPQVSYASPDAPVAKTATAPVSLVGVMFCVMLGPFVNILDYNVVNVSLPKMMSGLATDVLTIRWVVTSQLIATAVMMPALGWIGRVLGNKNLYVLGLAVFTGASALCGMAPNVNILIVLRILQGLGAGTLMPMTMVLMLENYPPHKRGMGMALWGLGASLGSGYWTATRWVLCRRCWLARGVLRQPHAWHPRRHRNPPIRTCLPTGTTGSV